MGRIGKLLSFVRTLTHGAHVSNVKLDPGGGANITSQNFQDAGGDAFPLTTDYTAGVDLKRQGVAVVVGYIDPINEPKSLEGEKRIYARDIATGLVIAEVWIKNDGEVTTFNANGSNTLRPDGGSVTTTPLSTFDSDADGSIAGVNGNGAFELETGGDFVVNGVTIDTAGKITSPTSISAPSIVANSKELAGHTHPVTSAPGTTGPNNPTPP